MFSRSRVKWYLFTLSLVAVAAISPQAYAGYIDMVLAESPQYYWNWEDSGQTTANLGSGAGGILQGGTNAARGASLPNLGQGDSIPYQPGRQWTSYIGEGTALQDGTYSSYAIEFWMYHTAANTLQDSQYISFTGVLPEYYPESASVIYNWGGVGIALETFDGATEQRANLTPVLQNNTWYHVVIGYKANGGGADLQTCILDSAFGQVVTTSNAIQGREYDANNGIIIGSSNHLGPATGNIFTGMLDEYAIYNLSGLDQAAYDAKLASLAGHFAYAVPEPGTMLLLATGMIGLLAYPWRKRK